LTILIYILTSTRSTSRITLEIYGIILDIAITLSFLNLTHVWNERLLLLLLLVNDFGLSVATFFLSNHRNLNVIKVKLFAIIVIFLGFADIGMIILVLKKFFVSLFTIIIGIRWHHQKTVMGTFSIRWSVILVSNIIILFFYFFT